MGADFLQKIVAYKQTLLEQKKAYYASLPEKAAHAPSSPASPSKFKKEISQPGRIHLIAEIKKASPSAGVIRADFNVAEIAKIYQAHGAAAVSVLTEDKYFQGNPEYVKAVCACVPLPVLAKDFFIEEAQIFEAKLNGAGAVLLIAAILEDKKLKGLFRLAQELGLDCLVEIHDEWDLDRAYKIEAEIIGVNNRDLRTFNVDLRTCARLIPRIPRDKVIVVESGIKTHDDIRRVRDLGAHAVLIGETFMRAKDMGSKIDEVMRGI